MSIFRVVWLRNAAKPLPGFFAGLALEDRLVAPPLFDNAALHPAAVRSAFCDERDPR